ncbi:hypothetical protein A1O7_04039 [Cladophialophora yegresii CBS 114405]|uniref:Uncharacterized protein n=1 Tax=Cladophialophora yegresii CBS 114405 TaxID=1182544 RepID=W9VVS7_9EURO|nr:uncharacterized protein A1O7_04039 [Cladophialophora yegresii CBS 114405]EXJ59892.1 hypothetical protein A1O7_04039 [Cladophialophora yegresii CBS 114405]
MVLKTLLTFDTNDYRSRFQGYYDPQLQKKEVVLIGTLYSSTAGVISGVVMAPETGGGLPVSSVANGRAMELVERKLATVRAELKSRSVAGAIGVLPGVEGHPVGTVVGAALNLVGVGTQPLDHVQTPPDRPINQGPNNLQKFRRSLTESASSKARSLQCPFSSEHKDLFRKYNNLLRSKKTLEGR